MKKIEGVCKVDGCGRSLKARGYCNAHYAQFKRVGQIVAAEINTRVAVKPAHCVIAGCDNPVKGKGLCGMHWARKNRHGHTRYPERTKLPKYCTFPDCTDWLYAGGLCNRHYVRVRKYLEQHGLSREQTIALLVAKGTDCDICEGAQTTRNNASAKLHDLYLDHDHKTGKLRGFLCNNCNRGLGFFKDSAALLRRAADYLDAHATPA